MNMKKLVMALFTVIVVIAFVASALAFRQGWGKGNGLMPYAGFDPAVLSQLNLTVEQATEINVFRDAFLKDTKPLRDMMFSKRDDLRLLWLQQSPDQGKILVMRLGQLFHGETVGKNETGGYSQAALYSWNLRRPDKSRHQTFNRMEHEQKIL